MSPNSFSNFNISLPRQLHEVTYRSASRPHKLWSAGVTHFSRVIKAVIDVPSADHERELAFWRGATGAELPQFSFTEYHGSALPGQEFALLVQRLDDGQAGVHLDIHTDDVDAEVDRLEKLGAERVQQAHSLWWIMRDPAGLAFCVIPDPPGSLNEENSHRWD